MMMKGFKKTHREKENSEKKSDQIEREREREAVLFVQLSQTENYGLTEQTNPIKNQLWRA